MQATSDHTTKRNHSSVIGQGAVKALQGSMIVSGMNNCIRIIDLLRLMRLIGIVSVILSPPFRFLSVVESDAPYSS